MEDYLLFMDNVSTPNFTSINTMFCLWQENMYWHARTRATVKVWLHHVREPLVWESSNDREKKREKIVCCYDSCAIEKKNINRENVCMAIPIGNIVNKRKRVLTQQHGQRVSNGDILFIIIESLILNVMRKLNFTFPTYCWAQILLLRGYVILWTKK